MNKPFQAFRFPFAAAMLAAMTVAGCQSGDVQSSPEKAMAITAAPAPVQATVAQQAGAAKIEEFASKVDAGKTIYIVAFNKNGKTVELEINPDGSIVAIETEMKLSELPPAVRATITKEVGTMEITELESYQSKGVTSYKVDAKGDAGTLELSVDPSGKVLKREMKNAK